MALMGSNFKIQDETFFQVGIVNSQFLGKVRIYAEHERYNFTFPINPEEVSFTREGKNETREIINGGDVNILRTPGLVTTTIDTIIPGWQTRNNNESSLTVGTNGSISTPEYIRSALEYLFKNKEYFRVVISGIGFSSLVSIEDLTAKYEYGPIGDLYLNCQLKQYRPYGIVLYEDPEEDNTNDEMLLGGAINYRSTEETNPTDTTNPQIVVGSKVICNGRLHEDSYGSRPGITYNNKGGEINYIVNTEYPYHFVPEDSISGSGTGWVTREAIKLA